MRISSLAIVLALTLPLTARAAEKTLVSWEFNTAGDLEGWRPNNHLKDTVVADGVLRTTSINWDPFLTSRVFDIPAHPWQCIELRIKATKPGKGQFFWSNTLKSKYGGFFPAKNTPFEVAKANEWETIRVYPFWQGEKKIVHIRFDLYEGATFEVDWLRVVELAPGEPVARDAWGFDADAEGWAAFDAGCSLKAAAGQAVVNMVSPSGRIIAPPLAVEVGDRLWVNIRMKITAAHDAPRGRGRVWFSTDASKGLAHKDFLVKADGRWRVYNVDMTPCRGWTGKLAALAITPAQVAGARAEIDRIALVDDPVGPPMIEVAYLGFADAINRSNMPAKVIATARNTGADDARGLEAALHLPPGLELVSGQAAQTLPPIEMLCSEEAGWTVRADAPGTYKVGLTLAGPGAPDGRVEAELAFTKPLGLPKADYVPEPQPVASKYDVGVFYFPGWCSANRWERIKCSAPIRKPVMGWYDEANPECADWQIKWAVEHGIKFFMVDWYWCKGSRHLDHWVHEAYHNARYRNRLKWCVMWANHTPKGSHSLEDWRNVTQYWIDNYFCMEEYYRIDDRPAVYIWAPRNVRRDMGGSQGAAKLYALSQQMAKAAGYKGIYFVAMSSHATQRQCKQLEAEGYEGFTSYHGFGPARQKAGNQYFPFQFILDTSPQLWADCDARSSGLLYQPIVDTGWSAFPWHGDRALIIHSRTPKLFGQLCRLGRDYADKTGKKIVAIGPWNEWGEGSYIEPCAEYGFDMLDELRAAFCGPGPYPPNIAPVDVGLGPYDLPMEPQRFKTAWTFDESLENWGSMMGMTRAKCERGCMAAASSSRDPAFACGGLRIRTKRWPRLVIRMKAIGVNRGDKCQIFWATPTAGTCEPASMRLPVVEGQFHDYVFNLSENKRWRSLVTRLRFDPCSTSGAQIAIDEIRFEAAK